MTYNDLHIQPATARPPLYKVPSKKGATYRTDIETDEGRKKAYIKLLSVEDIAREALCATLARKVHLPIRQAYYVYVNPDDITDGKPGNHLDVAFGIEEDAYPTFRGGSHHLDREILKWEDALACAVFDEWIYNRDRNASNLVFTSSRVFWLIDHDEALPNYALPSPGSVCGSQLLYKLGSGVREMERHRLKQRALQMIEQYRQIDWAETYDLLRVDVLDHSQPHFERYINFLRERLYSMPSIVREILGIRQTELDFGQGSDSNAEREENKDKN